jgi:hypothetical protein
VNDANDMTTTLQSLGFSVDTVLDGNRAQMAEAISRLKNRLSVSNNSYGFLFYAGHGVQFNGVNYLIPAKADIPSANYLGDTAISVQTMLAELNDAGNELNIVVLDACRDFPAAWSRSMNRGLSVLTNQPADSIIVYATSAGSTAADGSGRNGLFTSQLLKNLTSPDLDVSEVFRRTGADVSQMSNRQQIPAVYNQFFGIAYLNQTGEQPVAAVQVRPELPSSPRPMPVITGPKDKAFDVALKFSLGLAMGITSFGDHPTYDTKYEDSFYSATYFNIFEPTVSLKFLFLLDNNLRFGISYDAAYSIYMVMVQEDNAYLDMAGTCALSAIAGYNNIYLNLGYDFALGALYIAPSYTINKHFLISLPMSLFGSNHRFSIVQAMSSPDMHDFKFSRIGLSVQYVFGKK